jgi:YebC/PmpR family DNA-binding regulatory protein
VAARLGGGDLESNARLRTVVVKARSNSMPRDNIERAIKKGTGELEAEQYVEKVYEGYGPGGVAVMVECLTDNINRTVADVRHAFSKFGGNLGTEGSVAYMFHKKGTIVYQRSKIKDFDSLFEKALEAGAEDVKEDEDAVEIITTPESFHALKDVLDRMGLEADVADIMRVPENYSAIDSEKAVSMQKLIDWLEDNDDVQNVYHNAEMPQ